MRVLPFLLLAVASLLMAAPVSAQALLDPPAIDAEVAWLDLPATDDGEGNPWWYYRLSHEVDAAQGNVTYEVRSPRMDATVACDCPHNVTEFGGGRFLTVSFDEGATGMVRVVYTYALEAGPDSHLGTLVLAPGGTLRLFVDEGSHVASSASFAATEAMDPIEGRQAWTITSADGGALWFAVTPSPAAAKDTVASGFDFTALLIGVGLGVVGWATLVRLGVVQKKSRKQVAGTAAHKGVAKAEPKATLEARKRALMAALKELELAKQAKEVDREAYDAVKAELKKQTVTVMRALEETGS